MPGIGSGESNTPTCAYVGPRAPTYAGLGITERAAQAIVADLANQGYVTRTKVGRRNRYEVTPDAPLRHPLEHDHTVGGLLITLGRLKPRRSRRPA